MKRIVLENLRSAYNVGNIVRTADALWWWVIRVGYTARADHKQVRKTSLWAEEHIPKMEFDTIADFLSFISSSLVGRCLQDGGSLSKEKILIAAELTSKSIDLTTLQYADHQWELFLIVGNEVTGVEQESLSQCNHIVHIPMLGVKESLNVWQAAAIMMWEFSKLAN
jgi:23S rRNA (guanosine2251-2'-O)-methyltransferase